MTGWSIIQDGDRLVVSGLDREWLYGAVRSAQASEAMRARSLPPADDIDPLVLALRARRLEVGASSKSLTRILRTNTTPHETGRSSPGLALLRPWAYLLDRDITLTERRPQ